ncbi:hypothetical protein [Streptomyces sp. Z26]|uniref:hypothetical protein n=1 Tax=Streptomyces sp. Z26 TaxID=2500177 RepID=UPI000EF1674F|nr:hypothetical protein [Streptomyces sp. Z26]RLL67126.1 hypothetical protein D7M15_09895 [Streptomyces sp. Z26]
MNNNKYYILDDPALLALGGGNRAASSLIVRGHRTQHIKLLAPALCVLQADQMREGVGIHVGALEMLDTVDLDFASTLAVSQLVRKGVPLGIAHARVAAAPSAYRPDGATIATVAPENYARVEVRVLDLNA